MMHSVHCRGVLPFDLKGNFLEEVIHEFLRGKDDMGQILHVRIIPEYSTLLYIANQKKELNELLTLDQAIKEHAEGCFLPNYFHTENEYEEKCNSLDNLVIL